MSDPSQLCSLFLGGLPKAPHLWRPPALAAHPPRLVLSAVVVLPGAGALSHHVVSRAAQSRSEWRHFLEGMALLYPVGSLCSLASRVQRLQVLGAWLWGAHPQLSRLGTGGGEAWAVGEGCVGFFKHLYRGTVHIPCNPPIESAIHWLSAYPQNCATLTTV